MITAARASLTSLSPRFESNPYESTAFLFLSPLWPTNVSPLGWFNRIQQIVQTKREYFKNGSSQHRRLLLKRKVAEGTSFAALTKPRTVEA